MSPLEGVIIIPNGIPPTSSVDRRDSYDISNDPCLLHHQRVLGLHGCGAHKNSTVKRARAAAILGWVTPWEVCTRATKNKAVSPSWAKRTILVSWGRMLQNGIRDTPVPFGMWGKTSSRTMSPLGGVIVIPNGNLPNVGQKSHWG